MADKSQMKGGSLRFLLGRTTGWERSLNACVQLGVVRTVNANQCSHSRQHVSHCRGKQRSGSRTELKIRRPLWRIPLADLHLRYAQDPVSVNKASTFCAGCHSAGWSGTQWSPRLARAARSIIEIRMGCLSNRQPPHDALWQPTGFQKTGIVYPMLGITSFSAPSFSVSPPEVSPNAQVMQDKDHHD